METAFAVTIFGGVAFMFVSIGLIFAEEDVLAEKVGFAGLALFFSLPIIFLGAPLFLLYLIATSIKKISNQSLK